MAYGFVRQGLYKYSRQQKHLEHVARVLTDYRQYDRRNKVEFLDGGEVSVEELLDYFNKPPRQRGKERGNKQARSDISFYEVMTYFDDEEKVREVARRLSEKYNTNCYIAFHYDESKPHAHILLDYINRQGRALRINPYKDFQADKELAVGLCGKAQKEDPYRVYMSMKERYGLAKALGLGGDLGELLRLTNAVASAIGVAMETGEVVEVLYDGKVVVSPGSNEFYLDERGEVDRKALKAVVSKVLWHVARSGGSVEDALDKVEVRTTSKKLNPYLYYKPAPMPAGGVVDLEALKQMTDRLKSATEELKREREELERKRKEKEEHEKKKKALLSLVYYTEERLRAREEELARKEKELKQKEEGFKISVDIYLKKLEELRSFGEAIRKRDFAGHREEEEFFSPPPRVKVKEVELKSEKVGRIEMPAIRRRPRR